MLSAAITIDSMPAWKQVHQREEAAQVRHLGAGHVIGGIDHHAARHDRHGQRADGADRVELQGERDLVTGRSSG